MQTTLKIKQQSGDMLLTAYDTTGQPLGHGRLAHPLTPFLIGALQDNVCFEQGHKGNDPESGITYNHGILYLGTACVPLSDDERAGLIRVLSTSLKPHQSLKA